MRQPKGWEAVKTFLIEFVTGETGSVKAITVTSEGGSAIFWNDGPILIVSNRAFTKIVLADES